MTLMIAGLVVFLGIHSVRIVADGWRSERILAMGEKPWKLMYTIVSLAGFVLLVYGYAEARQATTVLYQPPVWTRHLAALLVLAAFVLVAASHAPGSRIKAAVGHPMVLGVAIWAMAHLMANGTLVDVLLFGAFLAWSVVDFIASRRRDRKLGVVYATGPVARDVRVVLIGIVLWAVFAFYLHRVLFGVAPLG